MLMLFGLFTTICLAILVHYVQTLHQRVSKLEATVSRLNKLSPPPLPASWAEAQFGRGPRTEHAELSS